MQQLLLDVKIKKAGDYLAEDFLPLANSFSAHRIALSALSNELTGCLIMGPKGVGKTHLYHLCQQYTNSNEVEFLALDDIAQLQMPTAEIKYLFIDNINSLTQEQQELLFHWYNHLKDKGGKMVLVLEKTLDELVTLKDLKSRLLTLQQAVIESPNDKDLEIFISKQAFDRQVEINADVLSYMILRIERNFAKVEALIEKIDDESLREKRKITVPFVKEFLD
tara:strand:- start:3813 stop:4478 length:666 start_codon:yes stop_codon:yes gene_type:complete